MGCTSSVYALGRKKKVTIPEVVVYVPAIRIPLQSDLPRALKGVIPKELVDRLTCLRNQIVLVAEDTGMVSLFCSFFYCFVWLLRKCRGTICFCNSELSWNLCCLGPK